MSRTQRFVVRFVVSLEVYWWLLALTARGMQPSLAWLEGDIEDAFGGKWAGSA